MGRSGSSDAVWQMRKPRCEAGQKHGHARGWSWRQVWASCVGIQYFHKATLKLRNYTWVHGDLPPSLGCHWAPCWRGQAQDITHEPWPPWAPYNLQHFVQAPERTGWPLSTRAMGRRGGPVSVGGFRWGEGCGLALQDKLCVAKSGEVGDRGQAIGECGWGRVSRNWPKWGASGRRQDAEGEQVVVDSHWSWARKGNPCFKQPAHKHLWSYRLGRQWQGGHGPSLGKVTDRIVLHPHRMNVFSPHSSSMRHLLLLGTQNNEPYNFLKFIFVLNYKQNLFTNLVHNFL